MIQSQMEKSESTKSTPSLKSQVISLRGFFLGMKGVYTREMYGNVIVLQKLFVIANVELHIESEEIYVM